ncbi:uncharacterized protein DUF3277 [Bosea sp. AK1]|uniref:phage structural protein n=1 Tax=Bosea sp. AK1 TaxID=2587160 RepID=UPI00114F9405|nr:phage protein [Bosea sp. AK1]TQI72908.1 uncharacterized protein DUF3277 [Bosea sp. AK1]
MAGENCPIYGAYGFDSVVVTIDGQRVQGFYDGDDAVTIEPFEDSGTPVVGADGTAIVSFSASRAATVTIRLMLNSPFNQVLINKDRVRKSGGIPKPFNISVVNSINGESGSCTTAVLTKMPTRSEGKNAQEREYSIFCPCWVDDQLAYTS